MRPGYLRISVTARCNLNCLYCRPDGHDHPGKDAYEPTVEDVALLARCAAAEGVRKVRITGGEPLLRDDLAQIIRVISSTTGVTETTLTTNGIGLARRASRLREAGLDRVNISLDTLRPDRFRAITGHERLHEVMAGIEATAENFGLVKLNTVLLPGVNDDEIEKLVEFAAARGLWIRFIERYAAEGARPPASSVSAEEVRDRIGKAFGSLAPQASAPLSMAESYGVPSLGGVRVGIISAATCPPCATCAKLRFTSDGELRGCLFAGDATPLRPLLEQEDESAIRAAIRDVFAGKRREGPRSGAAVPVPVSRIGG